MDYTSHPRSAPRRRLFRRAFGLAAIFLFAAALGSCRGVDWFFLQRSLRSKFSDVHWITTAQLAAWLADRQRPAPVLLDVRTAAEWEVSHLPGARRVDPQASAEAAGAGLSRETPIVTYCSVGYRSAKMAQRLRAAGFTRVQNLEGSIFAWANEGRPLRHDGKRARLVHPYNAVWGRLLRDEVRGPLP